MHVRERVYIDTDIIEKVAYEICPTYLVRLT